MLPPGHSPSAEPSITAQRRLDYFGYMLLETAAPISTAIGKH